MITRHILCGFVDHFDFLSLRVPSTINVSVMEPDLDTDTYHLKRID